MRLRTRRETDLSLTVEFGDLTVTMLLDGETTMQADCLRGPDGFQPGPEDLVGGRLPLPVRAFLVQGLAGSHQIDAGAGQVWHKGLGRLRGIRGCMAWHARHAGADLCQLPDRDDSTTARQPADPGPALTAAMITARNPDGNTWVSVIAAHAK